MAETSDVRHQTADEPSHPLQGGLEAGLLVQALTLAEALLPGVGIAGSQDWPDLPASVDFRTDSQAFELRLRFDIKERVCAIYTAEAPPVEVQP